MVYPLQTNVFALILLMIVYGAMRQNKPVALRNERYFFAMIYSVGAILIFDTATEILNGAPGTIYYGLHVMATFLLFATSGFVVLFWVLYTIDYIGIKTKTYIKILYTVPAFLFVWMAFMSLFFDMFFHINSDNIYTRGPLFSFYTVIFVGYVFAVFIFIFIHRTYMKRQDWVPLITLPIFPGIGGGIQFLYYGVLLFWPMAALSLLIVFIFIQLRLIRIDNLTQLYNKHEFNRKIQTLKQTAHQKLGCMVCDIDYFKQINDTYGHFTGDLVLKALSCVFEETFSHYNHFKARIGGDEFGFLFAVNDVAELNQKISELNQNLKNFNALNSFDFEVSISIGAGLYNPNTFTNLESFFRFLDAEMYKNKKTKVSDALKIKVV